MLSERPSPWGHRKKSPHSSILQRHAYLCGSSYHRRYAHRVCVHSIRDAIDDRYAGVHPRTRQRGSTAREHLEVRIGLSSRWMTTILCNRSLRFSSKVAFISVEPRESVHDVGKIKRVKPEEPRSQECVGRAALGSLRCWASASSARRSAPGVSTVSTIPGDAVERGTRSSA